MANGKFIVIDGLDGSGKKTQMDLLILHFRKYKIKAEVFDFPQYYKTFFGKLVGRYLKGEFGDVNQTNPYLAALTFAGDRWQTKDKIKKALKQGKIVLANRFTTSSMAFMSAKFKTKKKQNQCIEFITELEYKIYNLPKEDLLIYLSVPPDIGQKLVLQKGRRKYMGNKNHHDIHEQNLLYLKRVGDIYLRLVNKNQHWLKINCLNKKNKLKSKAEIHQLILKALKSKKIIK
jgi:dTMP kinase